MSHATGSDISLRSAHIGSSVRRLIHINQTLAKARLSAMVVITTIAGFLLGSGARIDWWILLWTMLGTALAAAAANTFNQVMEVERDGQMERTRNRPLPRGQISALHASAWGAGEAAVGILILALLVNPLTALLGAANIAIYLLLYTPLKTRSTLNTIVGAVCGAIPPMMGWTAATGSLGTGGWLLACILFIWQIPHFLALAWIYREDYRRGGYNMLPVIDSAGRLTGPIVVLYSLALLPVSLMIALTGLAGPVFAVGSLLLGAGFVFLAVRLHQRLNDGSARRVFLASLVYLPVLLGLLILDRDTSPDVSNGGASAHLVRRVGEQSKSAASDSVGINPSGRDQTSGEEA